MQPAPTVLGSLMCCAANAKDDDDVNVVVDMNMGDTGHANPTTLPMRLGQTASSPDHSRPPVGVVVPAVLSEHEDFLPGKDTNLEQCPDEASEQEEEQKEDEAFLHLVREHGAGDENGQYRGFCSDPFGRKDFTRSELSKFMPRVAVSLLLFTLGLYINNVSQAWLQQNIGGYYETRWAPVLKHTNRTVVLWDVVFETLPKVPSTQPADVIAGAIPNVMFLRFIILPGPLSLRWPILCRLLLTWGALWFFRAFTIWSTPLPNPDPTCVAKITFPNNVFLEAYANLPFVFWHNELTCQDVMFSGHTVASTLPMLFIMKYLTLSPWFQSSSSREWFSESTFVNLLGVLVLLFAYYLIIGSHFHYTVDVLVGCLMTIFVFCWFHYSIKISILRGRRTRSCVTPFLQWLERYSVDTRIWRRKAKKNMANSFI